MNEPRTKVSPEDIRMLDGLRESHPLGSSVRTSLSRALDELLALREVAAAAGQQAVEARLAERKRCAAWATAYRMGDVYDIRGVISGINGGTDVDDNDDDK